MEVEAASVNEFTPVAGQSYTVTIGVAVLSTTVRRHFFFCRLRCTTLSSTVVADITTPSNPNSTGETRTLKNNYGQGGVGVGGNIVNRRGGRGGNGSVSSQWHGGGGGSAPAPTVTAMDIKEAGTSYVGGWSINCFDGTLYQLHRSWRGGYCG